MATDDRTKAQPDVGTLDVESPAKGAGKVALDIEDAPFLQEKVPEPPKETQELAMPEPQPEEDDGKAKKKKKLMIAAAAAGLLVVVLGLSLWWFVFRKPPPPPPPPIEPEIIRVPTPQASTQGQEFVVPFEPFWVELPDGKGSVVFLVCKFSGITRSDMVSQEMRTKMVTLRDAVYYYLKNKPYAYLIDPANITVIKDDLRVVINGYLAGGKIEDMLFESYLGQ